MEDRIVIKIMAWARRDINIILYIAGNATVADVFNFPGIVLPQESGNWFMNGQHVEASSFRPLSELCHNNEIYLSFVKKCDECSLKWDTINHCWELHSFA